MHNFNTKMIHPDVSDLLGLLLVVLAVQIVVDLKLTHHLNVATNTENTKGL